MLSDDDSGRKLSIVHAVRQFAPAHGGLENFVAQLARRQAAAGNRVRVVTLDRIFASETQGKLPAQEDYFGVEVRRVPYFGSTRYPIAPRALDLVKGFDVVHVHAVDFFCDYLALRRSSHCTRMVLTTHGGFFHTRFAARLKQVYFRLVTSRALKSYESVLACSTSDADQFRRIAGDKVVLINNPVDIDKFAGLAKRQDKRIVYFGRFSSNKRLEKLLAWFSEVRNADPDWRLVVAGREMDVTRERLMRFVDELGLSGSVDIRVSPSDDELCEIISSSSVFCSSSAYEGFGLAAVEAASAGLFPVLSDIPPHKAHVDAIGLGMLVDFEDEVASKASVAPFFEAEQRFRREVSMADVEQAVQPFGWKKAIDKFDQAYLQAVGAGGQA
ncbi:glycosyltransferase family 4 protein [Altererythrobacter sp. Z27]|uniref:glycosyltransferase family 4 protein n=1 Tax=Altererythrobacter sp. Z27 TaxID=3461147 RepID=UPI004043EF63